MLKQRQKSKAAPDIRIVKSCNPARSKFGVQAKALGICLISCYNPGRRVVVDTEGKVHFVHHLVWKAKVATKRELLRYAKGGWHIHHVNHDFLDNRPENLVLMRAKEHRRLHARKHMVDYNKSDAHRERIRALHRDGHYSNYTWAETYNGSEAHLNAIQRMWTDPDKENAREAIRDIFREYNKSEHHSMVVSKRNRRMWRDPEYRKKILCHLQSKRSQQLAREGVIRTWQRPGEGERRVLARIIGTMRLALQSTKKRDKASLRVAYQRVKANSTVGIDRVCVEWWVKRVIRYAKIPKENVDLYEAVKRCRR